MVDLKSLVHQSFLMCYVACNHTIPPQQITNEEDLAWRGERMSQTEKQELAKMAFPPGRNLCLKNIWRSTIKPLKWVANPLVSVKLCQCTCRIIHVVIKRKAKQYAWWLRKEREVSKDIWGSHANVRWSSKQASVQCKYSRSLLQFSKLGKLALGQLDIFNCCEQVWDFISRQGHKPLTLQIEEKGFWNVGKRNCHKLYFGRRIIGQLMSSAGLMLSF